MSEGTSAPRPDDRAPDRRADRSPALAAAVGVLGWLVALSMIEAGLGSITSAALMPTFAQQPGVDVTITTQGEEWLTTLGSMLTIALPFTAGVFLALWLVPPIRPGLGLPRVVARSLVATAVGAFLVVAVQVLVGIVSGASGFDPFGLGLPAWITESGRGIWYAVLTGVARALGDSVAAVPVVALACVLLRIRHRPNEL